MITLEIDRIALDKAGVDQQAVDRIYKGLFAGSVGVYDTLRTTLLNVPRTEQYKVMGNLWKAFQMLLQNCCPTDFKMIGQKLVEDQIEEINNVKVEFGRYKTEMDDTSKKTEI